MYTEKTQSFIDLGCGKGMCLKCAAEMGYKKVSGRLFEAAGFRIKMETLDTSRGDPVRYYLLPKRKEE